MNRKSISAFGWQLVLAGVAPLICCLACRNETDVPAILEDTSATLYLTFAAPTDTHSPHTRANSETDIAEVDVLSFKPDAAAPTDMRKGTFYYRAKGVYTRLSVDPATGAAQGKVVVKLKADEDANQTLVLLANARAQVDEAMTSVEYGDPKEQVLERLLVPVKAATGEMDFDRFPMWGELPDQSIRRGYAPPASPVLLLRSTVKFTLALPATSPLHFFRSADELRLYNYRIKGRMAPDNYDPSGMRVLTPTVPAGAGAAPTPPSIRPYNTLLRSDWTGDKGKLGEGSERSFYTLEADNRTAVAASGLDATCLLVQVTFATVHEGAELATRFGRQTGWYRIDFRNYDTGEFIDLLRNHHYRIRVKSVKTPPASTPEEAFEGRHTLECDLVAYNEVEENVAVSPDYKLEVERRWAELPGTNGDTLTVQTENTKGWKITEKPDWLIASPERVTNDAITSLVLRARDNAYRTGTFRLKAGRTEMVFTVVQRKKTPLEYVAELNLAGGRKGSSCLCYLGGGLWSNTLLQWAENHRTDGRSSYYNWYTTTGTSHAERNPANLSLFAESMLRNYHLPTREEWTGVLAQGAELSFGTAVDATVDECVKIGGETHSYRSHYYSTGSGAIYALRFKAGVNPVDGHPLAADNQMLCAYRYVIPHPFFAGFSHARLVVSSVWLGEANEAGNPMSAISNPQWWDDRMLEGKVITRIFPVAGGITNFSYLGTYPAVAAPNPLSPADDIGLLGLYWSAGSSDADNGIATRIGAGEAKTGVPAAKWQGLNVRPFLNQ
ncbi:hypothetical protein [Bacteroides zoogleoformans]|uniref:hypothetical protein n=1 Tax=Bacteroides zoogleoformans TaxID=28119 RepID=UPI00248DDE14|nr:hypothetical protein [Bacteroides zoogleoformans]